MATYFVSTSATGGGIGTSGDPFTLHECDSASGNVSAGDEVWVKGDGTYTLTGDLTTANGTSTGPIVFETYLTTTGDGGHASIDIGDYKLTFGQYLTWVGGAFSATTTGGNTFEVLDMGALHNCSFDINVSSGFPTISRIRSSLLNGVRITTAGADPINQLIQGDNGTRFVRCRFNTPQKLNITCGEAVKCIFNGAHVTFTPWGEIGGVFRKNVIYDTDSGLTISLNNTGTLCTVEDNIIYTSAAYGITFTGSQTVTSILRNNAIGNCTSGLVNLGNGAREYDTITLTENPFTDAANGDFSLSGSSGGGDLCRGQGLTVANN